MKRISGLFLSIFIALAGLSAMLFGISHFSIVAAMSSPVITSEGINSVFTVCPDGPPICDFSVIQDAVDAAAWGDTIQVAADTYSQINNYGGLAQILYLDKSITIQGGYTTTFTAPPDPIANPTILDAQGAGRVVYMSNEGAAPVLEGLVMTGGDATGLGGTPYGDDAGGGLYLWGGATVISDCVITGNYAPQDGGGIYMRMFSQAQLIRNEISQNQANYGGGIYIWYSYPRVAENRIAMNSANGSGGGIWLGVYSQATFDHNLFLGNEGLGTGNEGAGGMLGERCTLQLDGNIFRENSVGGGGSGLTLIRCDATLTNNIFADNQVNDAGGNLCLTGANAVLYHNTFAGTSGGTPSGIYLATHWEPRYSQATLVNTIIVSETTGIYAESGNTADLEATLWGSGAWANDADWGGPGSIVTGTVNLWGDPIFIDPQSGDYHIAASSQAVDAGIDAGVQTDIDGQARPNGLGPDIGADEHYAGNLVVTTLDDESNSDDDCSLREAIQAANTNSEVDACGTGDVLTDTITFDVAGTITVTSHLSVTVGGPLVVDGGSVITTSGGGSTPIWVIHTDANLTLLNLTTNGGHSTWGGGIHNSGELRIINNQINNNFASYCWDFNCYGWGGGIYNQGVLYMYKSTLRGNGAFSSGGGIFNTGYLQIINSTLSENTALGNSGAIRNEGGTLLLINSTLFGNNLGSGGSSFLANTIITDSLRVDCYGIPIDGGNNISSDDTCGFDPANGSMPNTDPLLGPLQDNGGPTLTHALSWDSPAIDAGDNAQCSPTDQRGFYRTDGDGDGTIVCDIGSYEFASNPQGIWLNPPHSHKDEIPGAILTYKLSLLNETHIIDTYDLELSPHFWESSLSSDIIGPLHPDDAQSFTLTVTIPPDALWYQTDQVTITATSQTSPTVYSATARVTTRVYVPPQIDISPTSLSSTQYSNEVTNQTMTISNGLGVTLTYNITYGIGTGAFPENVLSMHLDEPAGSTTFYDTSGYGNNATCFGNTCPIAGAPGVIGTSVSFDGVDDYLQIPHNAGFDQIEEEDRVSIAAWVNVSAEQYPNFTMINQHEPDGDIGWEFFVTVDYVNFTNWTGNGYSNCYYSFKSNEWYHIAMSYDRSLGAIQFYVNGNQICNNSFSGDILDTSGDPAYIGYNPSGGDEYCPGSIDELYVFNRTLTSAEIRAIYQGELNGSAPWLSLDPVSGSVNTNSSTPIQIAFDATDLLPGTYTTTLLVTSNDPLNPIVQAPVTMTVVLPVTPTVVTISGAHSGYAETSHNFTAIVEPVSTTLPLTYTWQASGQAPVVRTGGVTDAISFTWELPDIQIITVTASNSLGSVMETHTITITDMPISGLVASNDSPTLLGTPTTFTATIDAGTNISYAWDFGDDTAGEGAAISHTYAAAGIYTATVTASNSAGNAQASIAVYVVVPETSVYLPIIIQGVPPGIEGFYWRRQE
jgi:CSLREA domain-containing protein